MKCTFEEDRNRELTESEVIRRAQNGDAEAFEYLYKSHCKRVYGVCWRILKNASEAEDLTQQVFLCLFRKIGAFRGDSVLSTWLHRITVNAVLMHLRRKKRKESHEFSLDRPGREGEDPREAVSEDTSMLDAIERLNLLRAVRKLPTGYKRLLLLHDVMGYRHSEIAQLVGCSIGCSKSQVHKARKRMRALLSGQEKLEAVPA